VHESLFLSALTWPGIICPAGDIWWHGQHHDPHQ